MSATKPIKCVYTVNPEFISELIQELGNTISICEDLVFSERHNLQVCFAQDIWLNPVQVSFQSISEAANVLRQAGKYWYLHPLTHIRRSRLIEAKLRKIPPLQRTFPIQEPLPEIGVFSLLDNDSLIFSTKRLKKWPDGKCFFIEDKMNPPNRAYLKLWEAFALFEKYPKPGELVLDLGASPGGWTYVAQSLGANVTAVDKAPLLDKIANLPRVKYLKQSAFALDPHNLDFTYDWVLSDIACYPERALKLVKQWIASGKAKHLIFTIKLQGKTNLESLKPFQEIPHSRLTHLYYNKHEATFFYPV